MEQRRWDNYPLKEDNMAIGKTITIKKTINNKQDKMVQHIVEPIVVNGRLEADNKDINPGVNTKEM